MSITEYVKKQKDALITIFVFTSLSVLLVIYAFFLYFAVGTKGRPPWFYGSIEDVPGQSQYSTSISKRFFLNETSPARENGEVSGQHVMGEHRSPLYVPETAGKKEHER